MFQLFSTHTKFFKTVLPLLLLVFLFTACSDDTSDPLAGDLSFQIEGEPGVSAFMAISHSRGLTFDGKTIGSREIPEDGFYSEDLENGEYDAYQISASIADSDANFTLRLVSNGDIIDEATEPEEEGYFLVKVGEFPDFDELFE